MSQGAAVLETELTYNVGDALTADRSLLGGKGAGLVELTRQGLRVPPAFVLSTRCCAAYLAARSLPADLVRDIEHRVRELEEATSKSFGAGPAPLLLSVRSGAPVSMPGMMDTVLNLGLSRDAAIALAETSGSTRFMADVLARFHAMYAEIVLDVLDAAGTATEEVFAALGDSADAGEVYDMLWQRLQDALTAAGEETVPADPHTQLLGAIEAVFRSWNTRRAVIYRNLHGIDHDMGTAVVVQTMVFGNRDDRSGSGVVFSRNPVTGDEGLYGEYLSASQGEDVVAGIRTPDPVTSLGSSQPALLEELTSTVAQLEQSHRDVLDIEFTVESGVLYFLQVRSAKRTAPAAVKIAADFLARFADPAILSTVTPDHLRNLMRPRFVEEDLVDARREGRLLASGIGASPGQVAGRLALTPDRAVEMAQAGERVILARAVTSPTDLHGMIAAQGVVTATGGATSHAAVVARALARTCVVGCSELSFDERALTLRAGDRLLREGDWVSLDGDAGEMYEGSIAVDDSFEGGREVDALAVFCRDVSQVELLVRAASVDEIARVRALGLPGVVVAAADALATSPRLTEVMTEILREDAGSRRFDLLADVLAEAFEPLFAAAAGMEFGVRAIDFLADETAEMLASDSVAVARPALAMPLGSKELILAHVRGLEKARQGAGAEGPRVYLAVRNISDAAEARALAEWEGENSGDVKLGAYVASPRGALAAGRLAAEVDPVWVELRLLQAAMYGLPPHLLLTREPLEAYVKAGFLGVNPRERIDASVRPLLESVADAAESSARIGLRVTGPVSESLLAELYDLGARRFAVDFAEATPALLAFAKAATTTRA